MPTARGSPYPSLRDPGLQTSPAQDLPCRACETEDEALALATVRAAGCLKESDADSVAGFGSETLVVSTCFYVRSGFTV